MNILHPTLGDLIDRVVILDLKRQANPEFDAEYVAVEEMIAQRSNGLHLEVQRHELRQIHTQIWNINVQLNYLANQRLDPPNHLGLAAWKLNQKRIAILELIDTASGEFTRPEKVY